MKIKAKLRLSFLSVATIIIIGGIIGIFEIESLHYNSQQVSLKHTPLADAAMEIKLNATTAHLWFEEVITGAESKEIINKVWKLLDESVWYCDALLKGGENTEGLFYAVEDKAIEKKILSVKQEIAEFRRIAHLRFDNRFGDKTLVDQTLDDQFDEIFDRFTRYADDVEEMLHIKIAHDVEHMENSATNATFTLIISTLLSLFIVSIAIYLLSRDILKQVGGEPAEIADITAQVAAGNVDFQFKDTNATGIYAAVQKMVAHLKTAKIQREEQDWFKTGRTGLSGVLRGEQETLSLTQNIINYLADYMQAQVGIFFLAEADYFKLVSSYAYKIRNNNDTIFKLGEGLVGQAAFERKSILYSNAPKEHINITINSGMGESLPVNIFVLPLVLEEDVLGVIELATTYEFTALKMEFLDQIAEDITIALSATQSRLRMRTLLVETQNQKGQLETQQQVLQQTNEELQAQQEELRQANEELQSQSEELRIQQEHLKEANEELENRSEALVKQKEEVRRRNTELEDAQKAISIKAQELELASKYKSEFLANMSHELRTPLNSLLVLAKLLTENKPGNLTDKQVEYAETIHSAGYDLLNLINEILDLSKVEAGKVEVHPENFSLTELVKSIEQKFHHLAEEKALSFQTTIADEIPTYLYSDAQRLKQIINNLLSNAFKFTTQGSITFSMYKPPADRCKAFELADCLAISIADTGIGIPKDKQQVIFEAFQQADGTTSRRFGGTGLGLSISRQLARLLGGDIQLESEEKKGSVFTLYLPLSQSFDMQSAKQTSVIESTALDTQQTNASHTEPLSDDRDHLQLDDKSLLIVEDDRKFSNILLDLAREKGFKCLIAEDGKTGLQFAEQYKPSAIILDVGLPLVNGWSVMEQLKENSETRHIPVHFMSASDQQMQARKMGAVGYLLKPVNMTELSEAFKKIEFLITQTLKKLLVIVKETVRQKMIVDLVSNEHIEATVVTAIAEACQYLIDNTIDCIILDGVIEQSAKSALFDKLQNDEKLSQIPVIIYTERDLTAQEETTLQDCAENLTIKAVKSPERLLDEVTLFLHQVEAQLSVEKRDMLHLVHNKEAILAHKKVLLVDDDVRNTFALMTFLEEKGMEIIVGYTGKEALELLEQNPDTSVVLMDIMMPEMDGYEAMKKIKAQPRFRKLPIIALTAKAMKGDKVKCIEAGANDYLTKPVDTDRLLSLLRVWLYQ